MSGQTKNFQPQTRPQPGRCHTLVLAQTERWFFQKPRSDKTVSKRISVFSRGGVKDFVKDSGCCLRITIKPIELAGYSQWSCLGVVGPVTAWVGQKRTIELKEPTGTYERIPFEHTGLGKARKGSQFPTASHGGAMPNFIAAVGALFQKGSPKNPKAMGQRSEMPACARSHLDRLVEQSRGGRVTLLGRVPFLS